MKEKIFKPMLAPNDTVDLESINYPMLASIKLDGIRCIFKDGEMLSRSLKQIPNKQLKERFSHLKELSMELGVIDGELYSHDLSFQEITHFVMTQDLKDERLPESLCFYAFDVLQKEDHVFSERVELCNQLIGIPYVSVLEQVIVNNKEEVNKLFDEYLNYGFEGLILKSLDGKYKYGRATIRQGTMFKVKPFNTYDLKVIDVLERYENLNESKLNELGYKHKSRTVDNVRPTGVAACFVVMFNDKEMKVSLTGVEDFRKEIWENKDSYIGKIIEVKGMEVGSKDVLRHPTFVRFRDDKEGDING